MALLLSILKETTGLFIDDGALATLCVLLIAVLGAAVMWLSLPPIVAGLGLLVGCIAILWWSVTTAARQPR